MQQHCKVGCCLSDLPALPAAVAGCCTVLVRRDPEAVRVLRDVYRLGSSYSSAPSGLVDLSDTTVSRLTSKLTIMRDLKVSQGMAAARSSVWDGSSTAWAQ